MSCKTKGFKQLKIFRKCKENQLFYFCMNIMHKNIVLKAKIKPKKEIFRIYIKLSYDTADIRFR